MKAMPVKQNDFDGWLRVTTVLEYFKEPELVDWMIEKGKDYKKIGKQAMKIGSELDEIVKGFIQTGSYMKTKSVEVQNCVDGFKRWVDDYKPTLTVGKRLYSEELGVTGEPDVYWGNRVIDLKCAGAIRKKYWVQTAVYDLMGGHHLQTGVLRLHKHLADYEYKEHNGAEVEADAACFMGLLSAYNYLVLPGQQGGRDANYITDSKE